MNIPQVRIIDRYLPWFLLAVGVALYVGLGFVPTLHNLYYWLGIVPVLGLEVSYQILNKLEKYQYEATVPAYRVSVLLSLCSYCLPALLLVFPWLWVYLSVRVAYKARTVSASILGVTTVALVAAGLVIVGWLPNVWAEMFTLNYVRALIPVLIYVASRLTIHLVRRTLPRR